MGKKWSWFRAVKNVLSCGSVSRKKNRKPAEWAKEVLDLDWSTAEIGPAKLVEAENEQSRHAYSVALATAAAAEAAVAAAHAAAEVVRLTSTPCSKTDEEIAAIKIQTLIRGYLARRAVKDLRGLARLKALIEGQSVKRQAMTTLKHMQILGRMQSEVRARRTMKNDNLAIHENKLKHERDLEKLRASIGENWDDSVLSKEQREANLHHRQEAAIKRERSLAYAYTHQQTWRPSSSNTPNQTFMHPTNPHWGWSWLDRWVAPRPYEMQSPTTQKLSRPSTPKSKPVKLRPPSSTGTNGRDDDSKSIRSGQSERCRRHSIAGSSVRDDESLTSSPGVSHRYMASTESARARSRMASPVGGEIGTTAEKVAGSSAKKRLSFSGSPAGTRRHSGPPRVDVSPMKDITTNS